MANDYIINFTDPAKTAFIVKPYTVNGYASPDSIPLPGFYTTGGVTAVSANTSLVFLGKGMPEYGDAIQNNFVYLLENFANVNPPIAPIEGQLWYKNVDLLDAPNPEKKGMYVYNLTTTSWDKLLVETSAGMADDIDMGGFSILNMGGTGPTFTAANQAYVTAAVATHAANTALHLSASQDALLDGLSPTLTSTELNFVESVTSPIQSQIDGKVSKSGDILTGSLDFGTTSTVTNLLHPPVNNFDAATKKYVDDAVIAAGADGVVNAGSLDPITGILTLDRTVGAPVVVSGGFAPLSHTQSDGTVTHDLSTPLSQSYLVGQGLSTGEFPLMSMYSAVAYLDQAMYNVGRHVHRQLISLTAATTVTFAANMEYEVNVNKLQVFINGVKQYANEHGSSKIVYYDSMMGLTTETGLAPSTLYSFDITVDGGAPVTISITTPAGSYNFAALLSDIAGALTLAGVTGVSVNIDQYLGSLKVSFTSVTAGSGSSVVVSYAVGSLFQVIATASAITGDAPVNTSVSTNYAYTEVGIPNNGSTTILLMAAPTVGSVMEVLVWP